LFSFAIDISEDESEEASSSRAIGISSVKIKAKLAELSALLHQDTAQLVDDSDPANVLFKALRGQIPTDAVEILFQAAHLESRQLQYQKAAQRLADRAAHAQLSEEMMKVKLLADEKHKSIGILKSSGDVLKQKISDLSARREALLAELRQVEEALSQAQQEESQLPEAIKTLEQERNIQARKALQMKKKLKPVEGSADDDMKEIEEANQIRLRTISTIQALLNM
jgi:chromosome segregation ATPase